MGTNVNHGTEGTKNGHLYRAHELGRQKRNVRKDSQVRKHDIWLLLQLIGIYLLAVAMRMVPQLVAGPKLPFWDSASFYNETLQLLVYGRAPNYFPGLYYLYGFIASLTGMPLSSLYWLCKYGPPLLNALTVFPMYSLGKALTGEKKIGLLTASIFSILEVSVLRQSYYISEGIALFFLPLTYYLLIKGSGGKGLSFFYTVLSLLFSMTMVIYHFPVGLIALAPVLLYCLFFFFRLKMPPKTFVVLTLLSLLGFFGFVIYSEPGMNYFMNYVVGQIQGVLLALQEFSGLSFENLISESYVLSKNVHVIAYMAGSIVSSFLALSMVVLFFRDWLEHRRKKGLTKRKNYSPLNERSGDKALFLFSWFFFTAIIFGSSLFIDLVFGYEGLLRPDIGGGGFWIYPYRALLFLSISASVLTSLGFYRFYTRDKKTLIIIMMILGVFTVLSIGFQIMVTEIYLPTSYGPPS